MSDSPQTPTRKHFENKDEFYRAVFADLHKKAEEKLKANRQALVDGHTIELNPRITIRYEPDSLQQNMTPIDCCMCYDEFCIGWCCAR